MLDTLRRWLRALGVGRMTLPTMRLRLITIGAWVRERTGRVRVRLAASQPREARWRALAARSSRS